MSAGKIAEETVALSDGTSITFLHRKRGVRWGVIARHAVLISACLAILLPFAWILLMSFKSVPDSVQRYIWPKHFVSPWYVNYESVLRRGDVVMGYLERSLLVTAGSVLLTTTAAVLAGFALVHLRTPGKRVVLGILVASTLFPTRVTSLIGIYQMQDRLGLINKTWGLMLPYSALMIAISVFIMRGVFQTVPRDIMDSSRIDGASSLRALTGIMLPLVRNGIVVVMMVNLTFAWGEYVLATTLMNDFDTRTLPVFIAGSVGGMATASAGPIAALYVLGIAPSLVFFGIAQHWYMKGLQEGALKA